MEYHVPTYDTPTFLNREAALGGLLGGFLGPLGLLAGTAIGSYLGKRRMEKELVEGKAVKEPTILNALSSRETATQGWGGVLGGTAIGLVLSVGVGFLFPHLAIAHAVIRLIPLAGALIGAVRGTGAAQARMQHEYADAQNQSPAAAPAVTRQQQQETAIAPEQQQETPTKSFIAAEDQRRQAAADQQLAAGR